jgi:hypothetical protein
MENWRAGMDRLHWLAGLTAICRCQLELIAVDVCGCRTGGVTDELG